MILEAPPAHCTSQNVWFSSTVRFSRLSRTLLCSARRTFSQGDPTPLQKPPKESDDVHGEGGKSATTSSDRDSHGRAGMQNVRAGARNVRAGARNVRAGAQNVRAGARNMRAGAWNMPSQSAETHCSSVSSNLLRKPLSKYR